jgi:hypothetical protein
MFKLGSIVDMESADIDIKDPATGKKIASVKLAGPEHPKRKAIFYSKQRRMRASIARTGKVEFGDPIDDEADKIDELVAATLSWEGFADEEGVMLPCTAENVRKVYTFEKNGWLRIYLSTVADERERFITSSVAS